MEVVTLTGLPGRLSYPISARYARIEQMFCAMSEVATTVAQKEFRSIDVIINNPGDAMFTPFLDSNKEIREDGSRGPGFIFSQEG